MATTVLPSTNQMLFEIPPSLLVENDDFVSELHEVPQEVQLLSATPRKQPLKRAIRKLRNQPSIFRKEVTKELNQSSDEQSRDDTADDDDDLTAPTVADEDEDDDLTVLLDRNNSDLQGLTTTQLLLDSPRTLLHDCETNNGAQKLLQIPSDVRYDGPITFALPSLADAGVKLQPRFYSSPEFSDIFVPKKLFPNVSLADAISVRSTSFPRMAHSSGQEEQKEDEDDYQNNRDDTSTTSSDLIYYNRINPRSAMKASDAPSDEAETHQEMAEEEDHYWAYYGGHHGSLQDNPNDDGRDYADDHASVLGGEDDNNSSTDDQQTIFSRSNASSSLRYHEFPMHHPDDRPPPYSSLFDSMSDMFCSQFQCTGDDELARKSRRRATNAAASHYQSTPFMFSVDESSYYDDSIVLPRQRSRRNRS